MRECFTFLCAKCGKEHCRCAEQSFFVRCARCGSTVDTCTCVCPYCGERDKCECATGSGRATGG